MHFGIHTGQQRCGYDERRRAWVGLYQKAGATWVNAVLRGPIDLEGLPLFMEEVVPACRSVDERRDR